MMSKFFIEHPVLSNVISVLFIVIGLVAIGALPISQYPQIVPPTIQVTTSEPGADAKTLVNTVALPIEQQVNGVQDMLYMQSTSTSSGNYTLVVTFKVGTDLNFAQVLVQNRVSAALAKLPEAVQAQGVVVQQKSTSILQFITLTSPNHTYDGLFLNNYALINMQNTLARLPGVGNVLVFGTGQYAMRIWLDPAKMQSLGLTPADVLTALRNQNVAVPAGQVGAPPTAGKQAFQLTVNVPSQLSDPTQFSNIIIKSGDNGGGAARIVRLRDVGRVELASVNYNMEANFSGQPTAAIGIYQSPDANALTVAKEVRSTVAQMAKSFPKDMTYSIPFDTTVFVTASIDEVYKTLFEACILVLAVILLFLQSFRATLVPATTVPVTIIGAFAAMAALHFSINLLTLFGLVLAIGIVVDDAIVVVEGVTHKMETTGLDAKRSAIEAMKELTSPIIGITLVLMSVFIPAAFMPGITGQMYAQFALVIAATALISAISALTLSPTQCALLLKPTKPGTKKNIIFRAFDRVYYPAEAAYTRLITRMVSRAGLLALCGLGLIALAVFGLSRIPSAFVPLEDQGYMVLSIQLPDAASIGRTNAVLANLSKEILKQPYVESDITISGISVMDNSASLANAGAIYVMLKPWDERGSKWGLLPVYKALSKLARDETAAKVVVVPPPPIQGLGNSGGFQGVVELRDGSFDYSKLQHVADLVDHDGNTQSGLNNLFTTYRAQAPQLEANLNLTKARALGVSASDLYSTLQTYLGSSYVNLFTKYGQVFPVYVQAEPSARMSVQEVRNYAIRNDNGQMVPLGTVANVTKTFGPPIITLYNTYPSAMINGQAAAGYSSGQALNVMDDLTAHVLPQGFGFEWTGTAYQERLAGGATTIIFALSLLLVYLVLAGQYESWITPITVLLAVPLALLGTVAALTALGLANNIYTQIGLVLLIALAAKNAILVVEVAREQRQFHGASIVDAAVKAATVRFRPILMTSFAFILGVMPLVFASGAGANSRKSIGIAVASGMLASTCIAVLFVPVFYVVLQRFSERFFPSKKAAPSQPPAQSSEGGH
ncbi:efflux RND transporter permease subunit [Acidocella aminolytica]|uniref:Efflux pump membrane transporter n=1 Tax=Acidocella aminolytica 101 = DSM 11237 TaxID=1120923 RepID=A0A0D6PIK4_9PROT|nr:efflux RND transporter permease subunit [Acidocella aminolytica]GAN80634.1 multidrug resistance efflux pump acriflavin resistance protein AcrB/AcrD/AcrF [Acidocella aminolytica 101 = DSM 11237]GBQ40201.1 cation/multidrug efflux pump [Acidocella aminolytica 101 = DSM 11237]SHE55545.1 hydrophobic/amphiphilic exporter-1, HAE1 family [Acidocella aminolytica 101 = DSM 11237]